MFTTGYACPISGSTDSVFGGDTEVDEIEGFSDYQIDISDDLIVECSKCGYKFIVEEPF